MPDPRNEIFRQHRRRLWPCYESWARKRFPQWYGTRCAMRHDHDFEACFDDALWTAMRDYVPDRGSFAGFFWGIAICKVLDLIRRLSARHRKEVEYERKLDQRSIPATAGNEGLRNLCDEAIMREPRDCQALLKLYLDPCIQAKKGFYAIAKPILELQGYHKTEEGWRTTFHRNNKNIREFLEGRGFGRTRQ